MSLVVIPRSHPDELVGLLVDLLAEPLADTFAAEVVAVPTRGIERWLTQRISAELARRGIGDGVCANVDFPSPRRVVRDVLRSLPDLAASLDAWEGTSAVSHVLDALDAHRSEDWLWLLDRYVGGSDRPQSQRLGAAQKITRLFAGYARRRPDMIRAWAAGGDVGPSGQAINEAAAWQPRLWHIVRDTIDVPSLPELLPDGLDPVRGGTVELDLPSRLAVYGLTAVDPMDLQVLEAVAAQRDVYLYLLAPSPTQWVQTSATHSPPGLMRKDDPTGDLDDHPLLASWGRDSRELQLTLQAQGFGARHVPAPPGDDDGLLSQLQADIRQNVSPALSAERAVAAEAGSDRSIQVHVCHGARRQVEVLRDAVLHTLKDDPTLEPRDIVIMTPDLDTFAPLLEAAFPEAPEDHRSDALPDLRVRIADRAPASTNPLVRFAATVLELASARLDAGTVRELVVDPAVRQRFTIDEETAGRLAALIDGINVKWGLDAEHRATWGAGTLDDHTWRRGIDRALAGVYLADSPVHVLDTIAPLDGVEGQEARAAGLLAHIIDRIVTIRSLLGSPMPRSEWGRAIGASVRLLAAPDWQDEWQWGQLDRLLAESFEPAGDTAADPILSRSEAALLAADWAEDRPSPLHFRTGDITVCTLVPMRSVPYRVVCLLGMDDERFPRAPRSDGDDLLVDHEIIGDPDRSSEDRQLLLDALMAAGDHLIVTYSGRDELTNATYPPAVPVAELTDVLHTMVGPASLQRLITHHPLQGFSIDNFIPGRLGVDGPWSFDPMQLDGARATQGGPVSGALVDVAVTEALEVPNPILLPDVVRFLQHPARWHLSNHLQFSIPKVAESADDTLPVDLNALEKWAIRDTLLTGLADGRSLEELERHIRGSDALPPGELGSDDLEKASEQTAALWQAAQDVRINPHHHQPFAGTVRIDGYVVEASVTADPDERHIALVTPSRLSAKQRIAVFADLAFLSALEPDRAWQAVLVGRAATVPKLKVITMGPIGLGADDRRKAAVQLLGGLVSLYIEAHSRAVPLPPKAAYAWQRGHAKDRGQAFRGAHQEWSADRFSPENADDSNAMVFAELFDTGALVGSDFPAYAARLWLPILPLCREKTP